jgi:hypothetical protein
MESSSNQKFDTLVLLVHPFWNIVSDMYFENYDHDLKLNKKQRFILNKCLAEYGKILKSYADKPKVCFCVIDFKRPKIESHHLL